VGGGQNAALKYDPVRKEFSVTNKCTALEYYKYHVPNKWQTGPLFT
jgi:hypothetical protein